MFTFQAALILFCLNQAGPLATESKIKSLQKQRLTVLKEATTEIKSTYLAGRTSVDRLQAALRDQYEAELELCETDKDRLRVLEVILKLASESEQSLEKRYKAGDLPKSELLAATAATLQAAISVEKLKAKLQNEQK
jgi:outer membrane protein TolC